MSSIFFFPSFYALSFCIPFFLPAPIFSAIELFSLWLNPFPPLISFSLFQFYLSSFSFLHPAHFFSASCIFRSCLFSFFYLLVDFPLLCNFFPSKLSFLFYFPFLNPASLSFLLFRRRFFLSFYILLLF
jgi:hypothetical protein